MDDNSFGLLLVLTLVVIALGAYYYRLRRHKGKSEHCCGDAAARETMAACPTCG